jgi:integrase
MAKKRRRTRGTGSVYTRKDGRVVGEYEVNGKTKYIYGRDEREVAERIAKAIKDRDAGFDSHNLTTARYLDRWLKAIEGTIRVGSWKQYEQITRLHIKPTLGKTKLDKINALQLQNLYRDKLDSGLSPRRVRYIHVTIHKALRDAVRWRLVPHNVAEACTPPKLVRKELKPLDAGQARRLLTTARETQPKFYALYALAVTTGMRQGELLGLQWDDVDLATGTLQVRRSVFNGQINAPKTNSGRRTVKLSQKAIEALTEHGERGRGVLWVFGTKNGTPVGSWNFTHKSWYPLRDAVGLPKKTRFHDLRHTSATLLLQANVNPKVVSAMLGHASIQITLDTYSHLLPGWGNAAASALDRVLE